MLSKSPASIENDEVLVCETCLDFFSNRAEFEGHRSETRHSDDAVLLRAVSATKVEEDKVIVIFEIPQEPADGLKKWHLSKFMKAN
jgi:hypothetical protein